MNKKSLIEGSIIVVVLIILGSLSNVVGYQSVKSTVVNDSPLFRTRTQRAINKESNVLTSDYLGKGINAMSFPLRDNNSEVIQKFLDRIRKMDDDTFNRFVDYAIIQINHKDNLKNDVKNLINELRQVRKSPANDINYKEPNVDARTILYDYVATVCWFPGCYIFDIFFFILISIGFYIEQLRSVDLLSVCICP